MKDGTNRFLIYAPSGGTPTITTGGSASYTVKWYDPRNGGALQNGSVTTINGGTNVSLGIAPNNTTNDWVIYVNNPLVPTNGMTDTIETPPRNIVYVHESYGWDAVDASDYYYNSINGEKGSGNTLVFRNMGSPWYITRWQRMFDVDDLTIIFEPGVIIEGKETFLAPLQNQILYIQQVDQMHSQ